ncbi:Hypothetical protein PBC10988_2360 [Planctomycetales bacterium 10988]|nr:Hypothetical protein PBC10988_2360 [Planctomycetales bacterium 10988]
MAKQSKLNSWLKSVQKIKQARRRNHREDERLTIEQLEPRQMLTTAGLDQLGVYDVSTAQYLLDQDENQVGNGITDLVGQFGVSGDTLITGDWDGDGNKELGIFRDGNWLLDENGSRYWESGHLWEGTGTGDVDVFATFGQAGDVPVVGDWNNDGKDEIGVFRNGTFYLDYDGNHDSGNGLSTFQFGTTGDTPVVLDWDGDGSDEVGIFRVDANDLGEFHLLDMSIDIQNGGVVTLGSSVAFNFGQAGDVPIAGNWAGDSQSNVESIGVFRTLEDVENEEQAVIFSLLDSSELPSTTSSPLVDLNNQSTDILFQENLPLGQTLLPLIGQWADDFFTEASTPQVVVGSEAGAPNEFKVYDAQTGVQQSHYMAFDYDTNNPDALGSVSVQVALGDVNRDGVPDVIAGSGENSLGKASKIKVFDGSSVQQVLWEFTPYSTPSANFSGALSVASGDVNRDGYADIIVGPGASGGPRVSVYSGAPNGTGTPDLLYDFYAFNPIYTGGIQVATGDVDGDGHVDIIVASGPDLINDNNEVDNSQVRIFNGNPALASGYTPALMATLNPYDDFDTHDGGPGYYRIGINVSAADFDRDGKAEIVTSIGAKLTTSDRGPSPYNSVVTIWNYSLRTSSFASLGEFAPFDSFTEEIRVATVDAIDDSGTTDDDHQPEIFVTKVLEGSSSPTTLEIYEVDFLSSQIFNPQDNTDQNSENNHTLDGFVPFSLFAVSGMNVYGNFQTAVNEAPSVTYTPAAQAPREDLLDLLGTFLIEDPNSNDPGNEDAEFLVKLWVSSGALLLASTTGLTATGGQTLTEEHEAIWIQGTLDDLNAALTGIKYRSNPDFAGTDTIRILVEDLGLNLSGLPQQTLEAYEFQVTPINDAPSLVRGSLEVPRVGNIENHSIALTSLIEYGPGGGADEAGQQLSFQITAVPDSTYGTVTLGPSSSPVQVDDELSEEQFNSLRLQFAEGAEDATSEENTLEWEVSDNGPGDNEPQPQSEPVGGGSEEDENARVGKLIIKPVKPSEPLGDTPVIQQAVDDNGQSGLFIDIDGNYAVPDVDEEGNTLYSKPGYWNASGETIGISYENYQPVSDLPNPLYSYEYVTVSYNEDTEGNTSGGTFTAHFWVTDDDSDLNSLQMKLADPHADDSLLDPNNPDLGSKKVHASDIQRTINADQNRVEFAVTVAVPDRTEHGHGDVVRVVVSDAEGNKAFYEIYVVAIGDPHFGVKPAISYYEDPLDPVSGLWPDGEPEPEAPFQYRLASTQGVEIMGGDNGSVIIIDDSYYYEPKATKLDEIQEDYLWYREKYEFPENGVTTTLYSNWALIHILGKPSPIPFSFEIECDCDCGCDDPTSLSADPQDGEGEVKHDVNDVTTLENENGIGTNKIVSGDTHLPGGLDEAGDPLGGGGGGGTSLMAMSTLFSGLSAPLLDEYTTPHRIRVETWVAGGKRSEVFYDPEGLEIGDPIRFSQHLDLKDLPTGHYQWTMFVHFEFLHGEQVETFHGTTNVVNQTQGEFGPNWTLSQKEQLVIQGAGALWVTGNGSTLWFERGSEVTDGGNYLHTNYELKTGIHDPTPQQQNKTLGISLRKVVDNGQAFYLILDQSGTLRRFDSAGKLLKIEGIDGNEVVYEYDDMDGDGRFDELTKIVTNDGITSEFGYNQNGQVVTITNIEEGLGSEDPQVRVTELVYSQDGYLEQILGTQTSTNPAVRSLDTFTYTPEGYIETWTTQTIEGDANSLEETEFQYDHAGRIVAIVDPSCGCQVTTTYIDPAISRYVPDPEGIAGDGSSENPFLLEAFAGDYGVRTDALGRVYTTYYDIDGRFPESYEPDIADVISDHELYGRIVLTIDPDGYQTYSLYDQYNQLIKMVLPDPDGDGPLYDLVTEYEYDAQGNLTTLILPDKEIIEYEYTELNIAVDGFPNNTQELILPELVRDQLGRETYYQYDYNTGRLLSITSVVDTQYDGDNTYYYGPTTFYEYNADGTVSKIIQSEDSTKDSNDLVTVFQYDAFKQVTSITYAFGTTVAATETFTWDNLGNLLTHTNELGHVTTYEYDNLSRLTKIILPDPDGAGGEDAPTYEMAYDLRNRMISMTDALSRETQYSYQDFGRTLVTTRPDSTTVTEEYDVVGNLVSFTDALGRLTDFAYDNLNRVTTITVPNPNSIGQTIDGVSYTYDALGNVLTETDAKGRVTRYVYDNMLRVIQVILPDPDGVGGEDAPTISYEYDEAGQLISVTDELDRITRYEYDTNLGWLTKIVLPDPDGNGSPTLEYEYDGYGNLISETDALGNETTYVYDERHRLTQITEADPDGGGTLTSPITTFTYDAASQLTSITDAEGRVTSYTYDNLGRLITLTEADPDDGGPLTAPQTHYTYDAVGNLLSVTDPLGNVTSYEYDLMDRLKKVTLPDPDGASPQEASVYQYVYDNGGQLIKVIDPLGYETEYEYDSHGRVTAMIDALDNRTTYTYDLVGNLESVTDPLFNTTTYDYDVLNRLIQMTDALGNVTTYDYDVAGQLIAMTAPDPDGAGPLTAPQTQYAYDGLGRLITETNPASGTTHYEYDLNSNLTQVTDPAGSITQYSYDDLNRLTQVTEPDPDGTGPLTSPVTTYTYDAVGQMLTTTDPLGRVASYSYDQLGRTVSMTDFTGQTTTYEYDLNGNLTKVIDELSQETTYDYDALNRLIKTTDPLGGETEYGYDKNSNLLSLTDPEENTTTWVYDALHRVTEETNELSHTRYFTYDAMSNLTGTTDRNGREIEYVYDDLYRLTGEHWLDSQQTVIRSFTYAYDHLGRMTSAGDPELTYSYAYDILGRVTSVSNAGTLDLPEVVLTQTFDAVGNRTSLSATVDSTLDFLTTYTYDDLHRLIQVTQQGQTSGNAVAEKRVDFEYNTLGQFTTITRFSDLAGNNEVIESVYTYDSFARLTDLSHTDSSPDTVNDLRQYTWTYDALNRITQFTSPDGTVDYTYDATHQVVEANYDQNSGILDENYTYDEAGNRTNVGYSTGDGNQLLSDGVYNYEYDNEGNRIRRTSTDPMNEDYTQYEWDHRNRLIGIFEYEKVGVEFVMVSSVVYTYDVFDRRIEKVIDTNADATPEKIERYIYDGEHIALVFDGLDNNALTNRYLHGPAVDQILADEQLVNGLFDQILWPLTDHLGSVRDLADSSGEIVNHIVYDSFGNILSETDPSVEHLFAYTGRERDAESDLYYYRARYYDPAVGRFLSEDPIGLTAGDVNIYRYVGNTVTILTDPSGLQPPATAPIQTPVNPHFPHPRRPLPTQPLPSPKPAQTPPSNRPTTPAGGGTGFRIGVGISSATNIFGAIEMNKDQRSQKIAKYLNKAIENNEITYEEALKIRDKLDKLPQSDGMYWWYCIPIERKLDHLKNSGPLVEKRVKEEIAALNQAKTQPATSPNAQGSGSSTGTDESDDSDDENVTVYNLSNNPVDLNRPRGEGTLGLGGTYVTDLDLSDSSRVLRFYYRHCNALLSDEPDYVTEIEVPRSGLLDDPSGDIRDPEELGYHTYWIAPNTPGASINREWRVEYQELRPDGSEPPPVLHLLPPRE